MRLHKVSFCVDTIAVTHSLILFILGQTLHVRQSVSIKYNTGTSVQRLRPEDCKRYDSLQAYTQQVTASPAFFKILT